MLAREAKVSRSLINKMESAEAKRYTSGERRSPRNKRIPNYEAVKKIAECLKKAVSARFNQNDGVAIGKICAWDLVSVDKRRTVERVRALMRSKTFSQLPVFDGDELYGTVTDSSLLALLPLVEQNGRAGFGGDRLMDHREVILDPYPCLDERVMAMDASRMIMRRGAVLVMKKGQIKGIATKDDLLKLLAPDVNET